MNINLSGQEIKSFRSDIARIIVNLFFSGKVVPKKIFSDMASSLKEFGGNGFLQECDRLFNDGNSSIERKILSNYPNANKSDFEELIHFNQIKRDNTYILHKSWGELKEEEVRNLLPEDKLVLNKEIFNERLKGVEFKDLPPMAEKKIIETLIKDSIGLMKEEVILYYNLIKIHRLSMIVDEKRHQKKTEDIARFQRMADVFINSYIPKIITLSQLKEINEGTSIERSTLREAIIDKIKAGKFNPIPYITLTSIGHGSFLNGAKEFMNIAASKMSQPSDRLWDCFLIYILFQQTSKEFLSLLKIASSLQLLLEQKKGKLAQNGLIIILFTHEVFVNLCKQVTEIRSKYQKADDVSRKKLFRLYGDDERLAMLFNASVDLSEKSLALPKGEVSILVDLIKKYAKKKPILSKNNFLG